MANIELSLFSEADMQAEVTSTVERHNPFYGKRVAPIGLFGYSDVKGKLVSMGAATYPSGTQKAGKLNDDISGNTHYVIIGRCPNDKKMEKLNAVIYRGWNVRVLNEVDFINICNGHYDGYWVDDEVKKNLTFTVQHFENNRIIITDDRNPILEDNIYVPENVGVNISVLSQIIGNIGAYANKEIENASEADKSHPIIMLADETVEKLRCGERDEVIRYVEQSYNRSNALQLLYRFVLESELLSWIKRRSLECDDVLTLSLLERLY